MTWFGLIWRVPVILGAIVIVLATASSTHADVISSTPTLPLLDIPYLSSTGVGCFPAAGVCVSSGSFTLTSVLSSSFNASGQDINTTVEYAGVLTNLSNVPIGPVHLSGVLEQEVLGRTFSTETGSWTIDLVPLHKGFDWLIFGHFGMGRFSGATSSSMLRATPGWRRIKPARSMVRTIW